MSFSSAPAIRFPESLACRCLCPAISTAQIKLMQNNQQDMGSSVYESGQVFAVGQMWSRHEWTYHINSLQKGSVTSLPPESDWRRLRSCIHKSRLAFLKLREFLSNRDVADSHFETRSGIATTDIAPNGLFEVTLAL
jgi:hypothetical protein